MKKEKQRYVIGVDGGGTKTISALSDLNGKILKIARSGSSSPQNIGVKKSSENITKAIKKVLGKNIKIISTFIGLAAIEEEPRFKEEVKKELKKHRDIFNIFEGKVGIGSDQIVAFRSGTNEKDGVVLIAGTGCVAHGWKKNKEAKTSGWGWLADEGSAFWVGQRAFQAISKDLDNRGPKTLLTKLFFKKLRIKNKEDFFQRVYSENPTQIIPLLSVLTDELARKGDKIARNILNEAGKELSLSTKIVIEKLDFQKQKFPLVLVGGMFKSNIVLDTIKREIKKLAPRVEFIFPKEKPVIGAIKLAIENLE